MKARMANAVDSFNKELLFVVSGGKLTIGSGNKYKSYPLSYVEQYFDYNDHLCITLENGAAIVIPDKYFKSSAEREKLISELNKAKEAA